MHGAQAGILRQRNALDLLLNGFKQKIPLTPAVNFALRFAPDARTAYVESGRLPDRGRPYRCWGYPVTPALFIATVLFVDLRLLTEPDDRENALYGLAVSTAVTGTADALRQTVVAQTTMAQESRTKIEDSLKG